MAQMEKTTRPQASPGFEELLQVENAHWSRTMSPTLGINHDPEEYICDTHNKKSVLTKVKEKAKKLRYSLSGKKKHGSGLIDDNTPPSWGVTLDDEDDECGDGIDDDPEFLGAPMYESEAAPEPYRESARQHPRAIPVVSENHILHNPQNFEATLTQVNNYSINQKKTRTETTPQGQIIGSDQYGVDKGVSVKEYVVNKLEPGEDEKALSQAITEAISPKISFADSTGVVQKVKEAVSSLLWREELGKNSMEKAAKSASDVSLYSNTSTTSTQQINSYSSRVSKFNNSPSIPVSATVHEVVEDENHGKTLQAN